MLFLFGAFVCVCVCACVCVCVCVCLCELAYVAFFLTLKIAAGGK